MNTPVVCAGLEDAGQDSSLDQNPLRAGYRLWICEPMSITIEVIFMYLRSPPI